jgi:hypothetical protein
MVPLPKRVLCIPVGGEKQPLGPPARRPLLLGELGLIQRVALLGEPAAAAADRHPPRCQPGFDLGQFGLQVLQPTLLGEPLRPAGIATHPPLPAPDPNRQPQADHASRAAKCDPAVGQVGQPPLPLVA